MKRVIYLIFGVLLGASGYYLEYVHSSVSAADLAACEAAYRQQFATQPEMAEQFIEQCKNPATIIAGKANQGELGAEEAAEMISAANRNQLIKTMMAFGLMGGGIGAASTAFARQT